MDFNTLYITLFQSISEFSIKTQHIIITQIYQWWWSTSYMMAVKIIIRTVLVTFKHLAKLNLRIKVYNLPESVRQVFNLCNWYHLYMLYLQSYKHVILYEMIFFVFFLNIRTSCYFYCNRRNPKMKHRNQKGKCFYWYVVIVYIS